MRAKYTYPLWGVALLLVGLLLGMSFREPSPSTTKDPRSYLENLEKFQDVVRYLNANYFEEINNDKLIEDAINGMLGKLDPHTFYISQQELKAMEEQMQGSFDGIGIEFNLLEDTLYVVAALSGGPSEKLGIQAGDRIVRVDGELIAGKGITNSDVIRYLRGPKGSKVKVGIVRRGVRGELDFTIMRDAIPVFSVDFSYQPKPGVGYIKVSRFAENTWREFRDHLERLKKAGATSLILDLRGNPGGYLEVAKQLTDEFLAEGQLMVYTDGRIPQVRARYVATNTYNAFEKGPLVVLIDEGSASASEIVSGAVQDWDRGLVVGVRSFGKGLVQQQHPLSDGSAVRVVVSRYFTPSGRCIQKPFEGKSGEDYNAEILERYKSGELYDASKIQVPDSLKYKTQRSGRTVYGGGGIMPDVFVAEDTSQYSQYLFKVSNAGMIRDFGTAYYDRHPELKNQYRDGFAFAAKHQVSDAVMAEFIEFARQKGIPYVDADYTRSKPLLVNLVKSQIGHAAFGDDAARPTLLDQDTQFLKALELLPQARELEASGNFSYNK